MKYPSGIRLNKVVCHKGNFTLRANGMFIPGVHLVTGRVGSGKTTLGEIIAGVEPPQEGTISWDGRRRVMLLQDTTCHISTMTVQEEAASWHHDTERILHLAGLTGKGSTDLFALSRGELKRLELSAILTGEYDLIVLDEPFAGLDTDARNWVRRLIADHGQQVIILISHDITSLPPIDILWEIENGDLHQVGQLPEALKTWSRAPPLIRFFLNYGINPAGLSREDLEDAACRIPG